MSGARRVLAVDFGERRIGLAATDFTGSVIVPLPKLIRTDDASSAQALADLARERGSEVVVFGLPLDTGGEVGRRARRTLQFVARLRPLCPCSIETVDESHTTDEAHTRLKAGGLKAAKRKELADSVAAIIILERYLGR